LFPESIYFTQHTFKPQLALIKIRNLFAKTLELAHESSDILLLTSKLKPGENFTNVA